MRKLVLTLFISIFCVFNMSAQTFITPNSADIGETLTVFISGNSQSDFETYSGSSNGLFLGTDPWGMGSPDYQINVPNHSQSNWQWNSTVGSYGFYSTITIPTGIYYVGNYDLYEDYYWQVIASNVFVVNQPTDPFITDVWPDEGEPGENLWVNISGGNLDLGDQWSVTSDFRFSQYSGTNTFYGSIDYWSDDCGNNLCQYIEGSINIPSNQSSGMYDLEVWDQTINDWVMLPNAFQVLPPQINWIDPEEGNQGQSLSVSISGNSMDYGGQWSGTNLSDFRFSQWSGSNMFYGTPNYESGNYLYGDISIPNNQNPGYYDLEVYDNETNQWIMLEDAFEVIQIAGPNNPTVNWISPDNGDQGEYLNVTISGNNIDYSGQWSGTNLSDFRFSQWSGSNMFYGNSTGESGNELYGDVSIPQNQNTGWYDLEVYDQNTGNWIMLNNAFEVNEPDNMITPNTGMQGESLQVFISGNDQYDFVEWSCTSGYPNLLLTNNGYNISVDNNANNWQYSSSVGSYGFYTTINIPNNANLGTYDLLVDRECGWYYDTYLNAFTVTDILGCTDPSANNYDANANTDDGSCCYNDMMTVEITISDVVEYPWAGDIGWAIVDNNGNILGSGGTQNNEVYADDSTYTYSICSSPCDELFFLAYDNSGNGWWDWIDSEFGGWGGYFTTAQITYGNTIINITPTFTTFYDEWGQPVWGEADAWSSQTYSLSDNIGGCTDSLASNYDPNALCDDASCYYCDITNLFYYSDPTSNSSCDGFAMANTTSNYPIVSYSWVNSVGVSVSTSNIVTTLCNDAYIFTAIDSAGCSFIDTIVIGDVYGCTDPMMFNYNPMSNIDDGSCVPYIYGCTDNTMFNYDVLANTDDSSCVPYIYGCIDSTAYNYDVFANTNNGSCQYCDLIVVPYVYQVSSYSSCDGWAFVNATSSNSPFSYQWNTGSTQNNITGLCVGNYTLIVTDAVGCSDTITISISPLTGCTDPNASNYDPNATVDDGSCILACTDYVTGLNTPTVLEDRVIMAWDNMNTSSCSVTKYNVRYREVGSTDAWSQKGAGWLGCSTPGGLQKVDRLQLNMTSGVTYEWKMKVWYCDGNSSYWGATEQFTMQGSCPPLTNLAVQTFSGNHTKATFTWDSTATYQYARIKLRVDTVGASWQTVGGFGVYSPTLTTTKWGLVEGESYRAQARAVCHPIMSAWASAWTPLIFWSQPAAGSRAEGGTSINNLAIYPNPSRDIFNVTFTSEEVQNLKVRILNVVGEVIVSEDLQQFIGEYTKQINLTNNAKGIYFLKLKRIME